MNLREIKIKALRFGQHVKGINWIPTPGNTLLIALLMVGLVWAQNNQALRLFAAPTAQGNSTGTIAYQGRLADASGNPLTQTVNMTFRLYAAASGGAPLWEEQWTGANSVQVSDGLFNVMLGSVNPINQAVIINNRDLFLGITVGTDSEMSPRVQLGTVPFATQALTVPNGSITAEKMAFPVQHLLGHKTCEGCSSVEEGGTRWMTVKGRDINDVMEVVATTQGGNVLVELTTSFQTPISSRLYCGIRVLKDGNQERFVHFSGSDANMTSLVCSGNWLFTDLPAGSYTFQAMGFQPGTGVTWERERQIVVYEYLPK